jgi:hypothetical protein
MGSDVSACACVTSSPGKPNSLEHPEAEEITCALKSIQSHLADKYGNCEDIVESDFSKPSPNSQTFQELLMMRKVFEYVSSGNAEKLSSLSSSQRPELKLEEILWKVDLTLFSSLFTNLLTE